ncbi:hypothetical protein K488DRAFT_74710 [Vararia minispora EC-137]|uniref:Uncharacterized protein n=1 Tax=Vararia minispora EC-137 TaxID=1314806 RepID=A0ACB8Q6G3_9AGAM|nr:hypothetical protein K488DRAFT_74710 [Vararia minispora EC-137]
MPVTFKPAAHSANPVLTAHQYASSQLLAESCPEELGTCGEILQSFLGSGDNAQSDAYLLPANKGLITTVLEAYNRHRALSLRPDDIWLAIVGQFHLYVNAHAEDLRDHFVAHEGKKHLVVSLLTDGKLDFAAVALKFTKAMDEHITDPSVRDWLLPRFSTTTPTDTVVASVLMMATMKAYFSFEACIDCGIPRVTLEGERRDWEEILRRAAKLAEYGDEPARWLALLRPVLSRFVRAFDAPDAQENIEFWTKVADFKGGSGPEYVSGWITAFCPFSDKGVWLDKNAGPLETTESPNGRRRPAHALVIDDVVYATIDLDSIARGYAEVDVTLRDDGIVTLTKMVAGLVATRVSDSRDARLSPGGTRDVVAPVPGWWIYVKKGEDHERHVQNAREAGGRRKSRLKWKRFVPWLS